MAMSHSARLRVKEKLSALIHCQHFLRSRCEGQWNYTISRSPNAGHQSHNFFVSSIPSVTMPLPEYSRLDRASPPPPMPRPSSTLEKLISERIPLKDVLDGALDGSNTLNDEIHEAETARARLHSFIDSCREEKNPCLKTVQEIGYYNTELREWTTQLAKLEIEMLALQTDVCDLPHLPTLHIFPAST